MKYTLENAGEQVFTKYSTETTDWHILRVVIDCFQIRAAREINTKFGVISPGTLGGYVESEYNLSQSGESWIFPGSLVHESALVKGDSVIFGYSVISHFSRIKDNAAVTDSSIRNSILVDSSETRNSVLSGCELHDNSTADNSKLWTCVLRGWSRVKDCNSVCETTLLGESLLSGFNQVTNQRIRDKRYRLSFSAFLKMNPRRKKQVVQPTGLRKL